MTKGSDKQTLGVLIYDSLLIYQYKHTFLGAQKNRRDGSFEYSQSMFWLRTVKINF